MGFGVWGFGHQISVAGFRGSSFKFRVSGQGFGVEVSVVEFRVSEVPPRRARRSRTPGQSWVCCRTLRLGVRSDYPSSLLSSFRI